MYCQAVLFKAPCHHMNSLCLVYLFVMLRTCQMMTRSVTWWLKIVIVYSDYLSTLSLAWMREATTDILPMWVSLYYHNTDSHVMYMWVDSTLLSQPEGISYYLSVMQSKAIPPISLYHGLYWVHVILTVCTAYVQGPCIHVQLVNSSGSCHNIAFSVS